MSTLKVLLSVWWEAILTISVVITFSILGIDELDTARTRQVRRKMQKCLNVTSVKVQTEDQIQMHSMQLHSKGKISFECAYSNAHTWVKYTWLVCAACSVCSQISCGMCDSVTISPVLHVCCGCGCSSCAFWNYNLILHVCHIPGNSEYDLCGVLHSSWSSSLLVLVLPHSAHTTCMLSLWLLTLCFIKFYFFSACLPHFWQFRLWLVWFVAWFLKFYFVCACLPHSWQFRLWLVLFVT